MDSPPKNKFMQKTIRLKRRKARSREDNNGFFLVYLGDEKGQMYAYIQEEKPFVLQYQKGEPFL